MSDPVKAIQREDLWAAAQAVVPTIRARKPYEARTADLPQDGPRELLKTTPTLRAPTTRERVTQWLGDQVGNSLLQYPARMLGDLMSPEEALRQQGMSFGARPDRTAAAKTAARAVPRREPWVLGRFATTEPAEIVTQTTKGGGYTVSPATGEIPTSGIMVGKYANTDPRNTVLPLEQFDEAALTAHAKKNAPALLAEGFSPWKPGTKAAKNATRLQHYLGTWLNDAKVYLDTSVRFPVPSKRQLPGVLRKATKMGERTGQKALWQIDPSQPMGGVEHKVGQWDQWIQSQAFADRLDELEAIGTAYMQTKAGQAWWDLHGTAFERIYGPQRLRQLAGILASTAPQTNLIPNLRHATEYMRRIIVGEPIIQPNFRVPQTAVGHLSDLGGALERSGQPGTKMPMEAKRGQALRPAAEGRLEDIPSPKMRYEAKALAGDTDAPVLDTHWSKAGEDPTIGVYMSPKYGWVPPEQYETFANRIRQHARGRGITNITDYTARVWTGIREAMKTGKLFGMRVKKPTGESFGYADWLPRLVEEKAKHLGISVGEMEEGLRSGKYELLSVILSTATGLRWLEQQQSPEDRGGA